MVAHLAMQGSKPRQRSRLYYMLEALKMSISQQRSYR